MSAERIQVEQQHSQSTSLKRVVKTERRKIIMRWIARHKAILALLGLGTLGPACIQAAPTGESVSQIAESQLDGSLIAVGTNGVFRSTDHGETWMRVGLSINPLTAFPPDSLVAVAASPSDSSLLFVAGTYGLWRTHDTGRTWNVVAPVGANCWISCWQAVSIALKGSELFAGAIYWDQAQAPPTGFGYVAGVFRSIDQGQSWEKVYTPNFPDAPYIAIDPSNSKIVYLYGGGFGLVRSVDGGVSWQQVSTVDYATSSLAFDAMRPNRIYVGGDRWGVIVSDDGGSTWKTISQSLGFFILNSDVVSIAVEPHGSRTFALWADVPNNVNRLLFTDDDGAHWSQSLTQAANTRFVQRGQESRVFVASDSTVLVSGPNGIAVSHDRGIGWHSAIFAYGPPRKRAAR
jgi:photosystem II stability/assembly factor-like uncharacterized protein